MMLISFGTRPEYIKIKPILSALRGRISYKVLFTGQHPDLVSNLQEDVITLNVVDGPNRLDSIVASVMSQGHVFDGIDSVMVQGDTTSAFAIALAAFHRKIKVIHLEAGLRTYDKQQPYPEEFNRQAISRIADLHLCPTETSKRNLTNEKTEGRIEVTGNTVLDNLRSLKPEYTNKVVVTMHRRENHQDLQQWFEQIDNLAKENQDLEFIIPLHPNPAVQKHKSLFKYVKVVKPMEYNEFTDLLAKSRFVITDSGGLQEETSFLQKKCIVCRKKTERLEGVNTFAFMCFEPKGLKGVFDEVNFNHVPIGDCPYGDGYAAEKILEILEDEI